MKKFFVFSLIALMLPLASMAQKIRVTDTNGQGIPLASVLTSEGALIGTTDLSGVLKDVVGNKTVTVTHVSFLPQTVALAELTDGHIVMQNFDYGLSEIVVKEKPYLYVETGYRLYAYQDNTLRYYRTGILPCVYNIAKRNTLCKIGRAYGSVCGKGVFGRAMWDAKTNDYLNMFSLIPVRQSVEDGLIRQDMGTKLVPDGRGRWNIVDASDVKVGCVIHQEGMSRLAFDGSLATQRKVENEGRLKDLLKYDKGMAFKYNQVFALDKEGKCQPSGFVMQTFCVELNTSKGKETYVVEMYATDRCYMDDNEFRQRCKDINSLNVNYMQGDMPLDDVENYMRKHHVPDLSPVVVDAVNELAKKK